MALVKLSPCKVNLVLNILRRRDDGFHELETLMQPVPLHDVLHLEHASAGVQLSCNVPELPVDARNLVHRAATAFLAAAGIGTGVRIHLEKHVPMAAGLGGGSGNAATTLLGLNELFGQPLTIPQLHPLAAALGSDIPFFLQPQPALATGRGELIAPWPPFKALSGVGILLIHPGFGIATAWAYQQLAHFPAALNGSPGRAQAVAERLAAGQLAGTQLYNSLEAPALHKYPILAMYQEFLCANGALAALMSGSGSTTFALAESQAQAEALRTKFQAHFGTTAWTWVGAL